MEELNSETKTYSVQPGCRYAFCFSQGASQIVSLSWGDSLTGSVLFTLADGNKTESTALNGGWEVVAPTNLLSVYCAGNSIVSLTRIKD